MQGLSLTLVCLGGMMLVLIQETVSSLDVPSPDGISSDVPSPDGFSFATLPAMKWLNSLASGTQEHSRKKRSLLLPTGSSMEVKWSVNFPFDTFTSYKAKVQLALPIKIPFPEAIVKQDTGRSGLGRSDEDEYANELQHGVPQYYAESQYSYHQRRRRQARQERHGIYQKLQAAYDKAGVNGKHCLFRTICDVAEAPFEQGILGEMLNVMLTASLAGRPDHPDETNEYDDYIEAELHGKLNGKCEERYSKCKVSPFDLIPQVTQHIFHV